MAVQYAFGKIITQGLDLNVDAADPTSYPGSGTSWTNVVNRSITGSVVSCSFSSDFKGGIVFDNPSASVEFPGSVANYGSGSFAISTVFKADHFSDKHYLLYKNSGSYPNWGLYLSGSGASATLYSEAYYSAAASSSVSASYTFYTGSVYDMTFNLIPAGLVGLMYIDGESQGTLTGGSGSLDLGTGSLLVGNDSIQGGNAFSGSIYNVKTYSSVFGLPKVQTNYPTTRVRFNLPALPIDVGALDPDYQAILDRAAVLGYSTPSVAVQKQGSTLVAAMKEYGVWNKLDSLYVFATDGDSDFIKLNWVNPTGTALTIPSGFVQTTNVGLTGPGGLGKYIGPVLGPNYTTNDACVFTYLPYPDTTSIYRDGFASAFTSFSNSTSTTLIRLHAQNNLATAVDLSGAGYKSVSRNSSVIANRTAIVYNNSVRQQSNWTADGNSGRYGTLFSNGYDSGAGGEVGSTATISVAGFGSSLDSENTLNYTAILEYMTNIS